MNALEVIAACEQAGAADVGLDVRPTRDEIDDAVTRELDTPFLVELSEHSQTCPECEGRNYDDEEAHVVHKGGGILVACEGFHTALLRALVLRGRS